MTFCKTQTFNVFKISDIYFTSPSEKIRNNDYFIQNADEPLLRKLVSVEWYEENVWLVEDQTKLNKGNKYLDYFFEMNGYYPYPMIKDVVIDGEKVIASTNEDITPSSLINEQFVNDYEEKNVSTVDLEVVLTENEQWKLKISETDYTVNIFTPEYK